jgi:hypothetical protein
MMVAAHFDNVSAVINFMLQVTNQDTYVLIMHMDLSISMDIFNSNCSFLDSPIGPGWA